MAWVAGLGGYGAAPDGLDRVRLAAVPGGEHDDGVRELEVVAGHLRKHGERVSVTRTPLQSD